MSVDATSSFRAAFGGSLTAQTIVTAAARLRRAPILPRERIVAALIEVLRRWRRRDYPLRRQAVGAICAQDNALRSDLLDESLDALLAKLDQATVEQFARRVGRPSRRLVGFVMPGNVPGAGLHELLQVLLAGGCALIKSASSEPQFFDFFGRSLGEVDAQVAASVVVAAWNRKFTDLTRALIENSDLLLAFGDDQSIAALRSSTQSRMLGYGSKFSIAVVARAAQQNARAAIAAAIARDVILFEQRGCLSVHHVLVEGGADAEGVAMAEALAAALTSGAHRFPPPPSDLITAMDVRHARETARWRSIGGDSVQLREGDRLDWTVIYDPAATPSPSPLARTVTVGCFSSIQELRLRLEAAAGKIESVALADLNDSLTATQIFRGAAIARVCAVGESQSASLDWHHGGIDLLNRLMQ